MKENFFPYFEKIGGKTQPILNILTMIANEVQ